MRFFLADIGGQPGLVNRLPECFQFLLRSFRSQFHPAIGQISHGPGYFITRCERADSIPKANPLHAARIQDLYPAPFIWSRTRFPGGLCHLRMKPKRTRRGNVFRAENRTLFADKPDPFAPPTMAVETLPAGAARI